MSAEGRCSPAGDSAVEREDAVRAKNEVGAVGCDGHAGTSRSRPSSARRTGRGTVASSQRARPSVNPVGDVLDDEDRDSG